jgi:hypothetical protein
MKKNIRSLIKLQFFLSCLLLTHTMVAANLWTAVVGYEKDFNGQTVYYQGWLDSSYLGDGSLTLSSNKAAKLELAIDVRLASYDSTL